MPRVYCVVYGCLNSASSTPELSFFKLPTDVERRSKWLRLIAREDLMNKPPQNYTVCEEHFDAMDILPGRHRTRRKTSSLPSRFLPVQKKDVQTPTPTEGPMTTQTAQNITLLATDSWKVSAPEIFEGPQPLDRCRFCAEYSKDCVDVTSQDRPYLTRNKTALTLNDFSVELDFNNDALPTTVCGICDKKLQAMYDFFKQVKDAQESLIKVNVKEEIETVLMKTKCECAMCEPTPKDKDDVDNIDSKDGITDYLTVTKTVMVKPYCNKRKSVKSTPETQKKPKIKESKDIKIEESEPETQCEPKIELNDIKSAKSELKMDIKEETESVDSYEDYEAENPENDTETDVKPSVSGLATSALVNEMSENDTFS